MTSLPDHFPAHVKGSYVNCAEYTRPAQLTAVPDADHFPAHVKNSYVNCTEYTRPAQLTAVPGGAA
ncbi:hypothetical protein OOK41_20235 [Micromonospora sp. NBC_01655]|uniref:hypothetical protein n=1 Tax=Micromonospora sp. NBC_01655 TaxID=2975983 RepID=UPI0022581722|nr:hypothetical protein [Micromonospora sp. NBC_01655]MCX4472606.1 hypothetical protein [Micromonospora sp. NBC_01655]